MAHIWLIGMMGTGKTTVGALVAEELRMPLIDTDAMVMEATGRTVAELFEESEETFRSAERDAVASAASGPAAVVSTGGGVVIDERNIATMSESGRVILLEAGVDEIMGRLGSDQARPLLGDRDSLAELLESRAHAYAEAADHLVDTSGLTPTEVAEEVLRCVSI